MEKGFSEIFGSKAWVLLNSFNLSLICDVIFPNRFVSTDQKKSQGTRKENDVLIQRRKEDGSTVPYRVIDTIGKLTPQDW